MTITRRKFIQQATGAVLAPALLPLLPASYSPVTLAAPLGADEMALLAAVALDKARSLGASYADIRINRYRRQALGAREKQVTFINEDESFGFGVRVLVDGTWGFAASPHVVKDEIARITTQAIAIARANAILQDKRIELAPEPPHVDIWQTPFTKDPFKVPVQQKIDLLLEINNRALAAQKGPYKIFCNSNMNFVKEEKFFANTEGSRIEQTLIRSWPNANVTAVNTTTGKFQSRGLLVQPAGCGYEAVTEYPLLEEIREAAEDAVAKHSAKPITPGKKDLVLAPTNLWLTIHESIGHSTELDRVLGMEANFAGTSFVKVSDMGKLQYAAPIVNIVGDRTQTRALSTCGYDDDGVKTKQWHIIKNGLFVDFQTIREQSNIIGRKESHGACYADSWASVPFQRMPNVSLMPAEGCESVGIDQLINGVDDGLLIFGTAGYSIDQQRYNFQFSGQVGYEIKSGKRGEMVRDFAYQSNTLDFWHACDGLGSREHYQLGGSFFDGKGEPGQVNSMSHGCPPARFRRINVLNTERKV